VILAGEFVDQVSEVYSMLGQEVEYDPLAAEQVLYGDEFHIQLHVLYFLGAEFSFIGGRGIQMSLIDQVLRIGESQDFPVAPERIVWSVAFYMFLEAGRGDLSFSGFVGYYCEHLAEFYAPIGANDYIDPSRGRRLETVAELPKMAHDSVSYDYRWSFRRLSGSSSRRAGSGRTTSAGRLA